MMIVLCAKKRLPSDKPRIYDCAHGHYIRLLPPAVGTLRD